MYPYVTIETVARLRQHDRLREAEQWRLGRLARAAGRVPRPVPLPRPDAVVSFWTAALRRYGAALGA